MRSREIAHRYAEALYRLARDEGRVQAVEAEYHAMLEEFDAVPGLIAFLAHPLVPAATKMETTERAFPSASQTFRNLLRLLVRNGREDYLGLIFEEFLAVRSRAEGTVRVGVVAARALDSREREGLRERLARSLGRPVELEERVDPALLGGVRIEMGGKVMDVTLQAKLEQLKASLER